MSLKVCATAVVIGLGITTASAASAVTIIKPFLGGPFNAGNSLGTIAAIKLLSANTYDFTFSIAPSGGTVLTQIQASVSGPVSEPIQFSLYSGTPGTGSLLGTSTNALGPSLSNLLGVGDYYVQVDFIAQNNELLTGGLALSVPEPAAWSMMLLGMAGLGAAARAGRRKSSPTHA